MHIFTDTNAIHELLTRGREHIYPSEEYLEARLKEGKQLSVYTGYDPTAPTLHIGHGITLLKLKQFQDLGHKIIFLIGDFTGMIGDPTDKTSARQRLTKEQVIENYQTYKEQAGRVLQFDGDNPVEVKYNSTWLGAMSFADVVELASNFTVQQMLERDMFEQRITEEKPIYLHEFLYPLMQGYDSVAMDVDGELGGNDQTFNMLAGRTLMKQLRQKEKFVLTTKLLADSTGAKMSKTAGNMIALNDTPEDMFGKVMKWTDDMIINGFELCTTVPKEIYTQYAQEMQQGNNPRDYKIILAYEITKTFLGSDAAEKGKAHFATVIQHKEKPEEINMLTPTAYDIVTVLIEATFATSKSDARRAIQEGAVKVNDQKITDPAHIVTKGSLVQKGKRFFVQVG